MSKNPHWLHKNYLKLTPVERFKLSVKALERDDYDDFQWLCATSQETNYVGPDPDFRNQWEHIRRVLSVVYPTWVKYKTLIHTTLQALYFLETTYEQGSDLACLYYSQGYAAAWRDAGRSDDELGHTHRCKHDCDACNDQCDVPAEEGMYAFAGLQKYEPFVFQPAKDELLTQFFNNLIGLKALFFALEQLCDVHDITLQELVAINVSLQRDIIESGDLLAADIGETGEGYVTIHAKAYFDALDAAWNNDLNYEFSETIRAVYGPEIEQMYREWREQYSLTESEAQRDDR